MEPDAINGLHDEIMGHARISLSKAIEIGEALHAWKKTLGHGNWMPWLYARREELKFDNVTHLREA